MSPHASQPPTPTAANRLPLARWLRIGVLLFIAQALALGLQALLLIHKEGELLTGLTASRIGIAADEIRATFTGSAANGLTLAEPRGIGRMLPRLVADDADITAIMLYIISSISKESNFEDNFFISILIVFINLFFSSLTYFKLFFLT